jgi:hypothetical protein
MTLASNVAAPGVVYISLYGLCSLSGTGSLAQVTFKVVGPRGSRTPLIVARASVDENHVSTAIDDGLFNVCESKDGDGDGYAVCAGDCDDGNRSIHPGAMETCDGRDDDCNGIFDDAAVPGIVSTIGVDEDGGVTVVAWTAISGATAYDVVGGSLTTLLSTSGDFSISTDRCLTDDTTVNQADDRAALPAPGGVWYLVRPVNCGGSGSFEDGSSSQYGPRGPGIAASPSSCP